MAERRPLTREELSAELHALSRRYWDKHPFHVRLHAGGCGPQEIRSWVANRWYYQRHLSQKNAAIVANCPLPEIRRRWLGRISYQDGQTAAEGGLHDWIVLGEAVGLSREELLDERHVLRGTRFAVDAYVAFCRTRPWLEGAAAALTELFSPQHMTARVQAWREHYDWIAPEGMAYFDSRIPVVEQDSSWTLDVVLTHSVTREQQEASIAALAFKCDVLGAILDAVDYASSCAQFSCVQLNCAQFNCTQPNGPR
ncbi:pyrroloquinoline-quinone synthase PqqC [Winogradskya humida]|uniref:Pyrroloquinoline-quinone synthase n=1 Tax=Winogradskya humida TaxID=113566 RepID=A0ABQ3ZX83_9ACTN|nr:pyrroloquinoline-quinone synthase PqqC [Actinoplanes humidus]GIE23200.1 pyrroloquinoline-quinone synthase [Actinoplanes humidus]